MTEVPPRVIAVGDGFWNIRASFRMLGVVDVGTHASLVRRASGKYLLLDTCPLDEDTVRWIAGLTRGGADLEAILNLHPFHTLSVRAVHALYPGAALYGTARHHRKLSDLPWEPLRTEDPELHALFSEDLTFTVPRGVEFVARDPRIHFSSVLAFHSASHTLHVDDTLGYLKMPGFLRGLKADRLFFHPGLPVALERRPGAAAAFRAWTEELIERCRAVDNLCVAHRGVLLGRDNRGASIADRVAAAAHRVEKTLKAHERKGSDPSSSP